MQNDTLNGEKELLKLVARGNESAFTTLFNFYKNRIYSAALKLTHSPTFAEEIVQDVFLKIWQRRADLADIQNLSAYLFIVARNEAYTVLKRIAREYNYTAFTENCEAAAENSTENYVMDKEYSFLLQKAVNSLPTQQKQVYQLIKGEGLRREEAASTLKIQPETAKFHLAQAMKHIRSFCLPHLEITIGLIICVQGLF